MIVKSKWRLNDFYQKLSNGHKVFDFEKIAKTGYGMILIMSERGSRGKTLNVKELLRKEFIKTGRPSIWLGNTNSMLDDFKTRYNKDFNKPFVKKELGAKSTNFWKDTIAIGDNEKNTGQVDFTTHKKQKDGSILSTRKLFIKLLSMNNTELMKGSRDNYKYVVYDEFNVKANVVREPINKFDSLLHSLEDIPSGYTQDLQVLIFGNNKSLNNPLIYRLGVSHVEHEVSEVMTEDGFPLLLIINPRYDEDQRNKLEDDNKNNWIYQASKQMGTHEHAYFNESLYDDVNSVIKYLDTEEKAKLLFPQFTIHHKKEWMNVYKIKDGVHKGNIHVVQVSKSQIYKNSVFYFNKNDVVENSRYTRKYIKQLRKYIESDSVSFEDIFTRELFMSSIR